MLKYTQNEKIIRKMFCRYKQNAYLCTVFMIERLPKIQKFG